MSSLIDIAAPTAVYRFFSQDAALLYVGVTDSLGTRWRNHSKNKPWWSQVADTRIVWYNTRAEALAEEERAIKEERPRYNIVHASHPRARSMSELTPAQAAALHELDQVAVAREELDREIAQLNERERSVIQMAWRDKVPPTEIALLVDRSAAHVRKLRPADVPPARTGGTAKVKRQSEQP